MSLVPMRSILEATEKYNYAQGAFNVNAVAQAKAVIEVHEMFRSAAIIQGADLANAFMGGCTDFANGTLEDKKIGANNIAKAVKKYAENNILDQLKQEIEVAAFASLSRRFTPIWSTTASHVCMGPSSTWIGVLLLQ